MLYPLSYGRNREVELSVYQSLCAGFTPGTAQTFLAALASVATSRSLKHGAKRSDVPQALQGQRRIHDALALVRLRGTSGSIGLHRIPSRAH